MINATEARAKMMSLKQHLVQISSDINTACANNERIIQYDIKGTKSDIFEQLVDELKELGYILQRYNMSNNLQISW